MREEERNILKDKRRMGMLDREGRLRSGRIGGSGSEWEGGKWGLGGL